MDKCKPVDVFSDKHFSFQEMKDISALISKIDEIIKPKMITITCQERERLSEDNKNKRLFTSKVIDYRLGNSELSSKEIDWDAFNLTFADKTFLRSSMLCLQNILIQMDNTRLVYDYENYKTALIDFEKTCDKAEAKEMRYEVKYKELKALFAEIK